MLSSPAPPRRNVRAEPVMGTVITVDVRDGDLPEAAMDAVFGWFHDVDETFSTFRIDSEISRLSRGELREHECSPDVREVLALCEEVRVCSNGSFDIRRGGGIDPLRLVQGWGGERGATLPANCG